MKAKFKMALGSVELPSKFIVCDCCQGTGTELGHGLKGVAFTPSEMDDTFLDNYMSGYYDVACSNCKGDRVVPGFDVSRMTFAEKRQAVEVRRSERYRRGYNAARESWLEGGGFGDFDYND